LLSNNGIELIKGEAVDIDREKKSVSLAGGDMVGYEKLVLATGSLPMQLPISGLDKKNAFTAKKDFAYLKKALDAINDAKDIVIIGGGFIQ